MSAHEVPMLRAEFETWLENRIVAEQERVDDLLADPDMFILSGLRKVHTTGCAVNGFEQDRRQVYHRIGGLGEIRSDIVHGGGPRFPETITRQQLTRTTSKYDRCQVCTPDVPAYVKPAGVQTHDDLTAYIQRASATGAKPARAVAGILTLHARAGDICAEDQQPWPCHTIRSIHGVWNIHA